MEEMERHPCDGRIGRGQAGLTLELLSLSCWQDMQMEVSHQESAIAKPGVVRGRREAVESNHHIRAPVHLYPPTPARVSLPRKPSREIRVGDPDWRVRGRNDRSHERSWWHF